MTTAEPGDIVVALSARQIIMHKGGLYYVDDNNFAYCTSDDEYWTMFEELFKRIDL